MRECRTSTREVSTSSAPSPPTISHSSSRTWAGTPLSALKESEGAREREGARPKESQQQQAG
eukprot:2951198-Rhodomonas_salina.1